MNSNLRLLLITILASLLPHCLQAQEDSLQIKKGATQPYLLKELLWNTTGTTSIHPALPAILPLPGQPNTTLPTQPKLPTVHFTLPKLPVIPYYINPSPLFKGDYNTGGMVLPHRHGGWYASGSQSSVPGIGRFNEATLTYAHRLNSKLSFQLSLDAMKVNMSHISGQTFSTSGMMLYQATDKLGFRVFGSYAPGNTFGMKTHSYGGTLMWQVNDRFGLEMGVQRYYDSMRGGWQTVPVVIPSYRFDHFKLELDVGGILYEILRGVLYDTKKDFDPRGATIAPPRFSFPVK